MRRKRTVDQRETFVGQTADASPVGEPMEIRSPIRDRRFVDERGTLWLMRNGELRWSRIERLCRDPEVPVLHAYLDQAKEVPTAAREDLLASIRTYLKTSGDRPVGGGQTDFDAAEFKDDDHRSMLVVEERC
jgi:hypothetical protein